MAAFLFIWLCQIFLQKLFNGFGYSFADPDAISIYKKILWKIRQSFYFIARPGWDFRRAIYFFGFEDVRGKREHPEKYVGMWSRENTYIFRQSQKWNEPDDAIVLVQEEMDLDFLI